MNKFGWIVSLMMCIGVSYAQIYKWTDAQGNVHFTDVPHDGAEKVKINESQTYSPPKPMNSNVPVQNEDPTPKNTARTYKLIEITQPQNEATIRNNLGFVVVSIQLEPDLSPGDVVQLLFDGAPIGEPQANLTFQLNGVYRGAHTVAAQVQTAGGEVLNTSEPVTFFMHRARIGMGGGGTKS